MCQNYVGPWAETPIFGAFADGSNDLRGRNLAADHSTTSGISGRYATALFDLANDQKCWDSVRDDLMRIQAMLDESDDLRRLVRSPVLGREEQGRAILAVMDAAEIGPLVRNFIGVVAHNRRLFALSGMITAYNRILADFRGEIAASVTSAAALTDDQRERLAAALKQAVGRDVNIETRVDENLIGGMVVRVGSRMIDFSLATKLASLRLSMKGVG